MRYAPVEITAANFDACVAAGGGMAPAARGQTETCVFGIGALSGRVYVALKVGDEVPNWSGMSNVAHVDVSATGLSPGEPQDAVTIDAGSVQQFTYSRGGDVPQAFIVFSDRPDFPTRPIRHDDGTTSRSVRYPLKNGISWWKPSMAQWVNVKRLASNSGTAYWRLEGKSSTYAKMTGPPRAILFDAGNVTNTDVQPSHVLGADTALWPDRNAPVTFTWTDNTRGMSRFMVDISVDQTIPVKDGRSTVVLGGGGVAGSPYVTTTADWLKVRKLAATSGGVLFWRVRAQDAQRALTTGSATKRLVFDGGAWSVGDLDPSGDAPSLAWTHAAEGYVGYSLQFSADGAFAPVARETVKVPSGSVPASPYVLKATEVRRLATFASRAGVTQLHYRVRAEDANRAYVAFSDAKVVDVPQP